MKDLKLAYDRIPKSIKKLKLNSNQLAAWTDCWYNSETL